MKVQILFDKDTRDAGFCSGWGVSYLLDGKVLFDTGEKLEYLLKNMRRLGVDVQNIEKIIISHNHWDHRNALWDILALNENIETFICEDCMCEYVDKIRKYTFRKVDQWDKITDSVYTTGCFKVIYKATNICEQAVIVKTARGISVICGCAHMGVITLLEKVRELFPGEKFYAVIGGFHLMEQETRAVRYIISEMKKMGVEKVGPAHCTGYEASMLFKEAYKDNYIEIRVGEEFDV